MAPTISILLPTHNKAGLLSFAIRSVLAQSFQDFEVLVVGDGCTDDTAVIVQGFNDPRLIWFDLPKAPNYGYANRNIALRAARGELVAFMAHDDLWLSDHLEQLIPFFDDPRVEIVYSRPLWVIPRGMIVPGFFNLEHQPTLSFFLDMGNQIPAGCVAHRRECLSKYGYWNDQLPGAADWDLWKRIIKGGGKQNFAYLDAPTCLHFKADWHGSDYDFNFMFPAWKRLFGSGQMPPALQVQMSEDVTEQDAVWQAMSGKPDEWNTVIRSAVRQVIDALAFEGISAPAKDQAMADELSAIKNSVTWRLRNRVVSVTWIQRLYATLKSLAK